MNNFTFNSVTQIVFGNGVTDRVGELSVKYLGKKIFFITDSGLIESDAVKPVLKALADADVELLVFSKVVADPPEEVIENAVNEACDFGAQGVIGLGGGSSMDVAKLVALLVTGNDKLSEIYGVGNAKGPRLPLLLIPTTSGTGSEVTPISIVTTGESEKKGVVTPIILPDIALLDPNLTVGLPPAVTATTGIDAMVHAIEAHSSLNVNNNPVSRGLACEALRLMGPALELAVKNGKDIQARSDMLLGSMLAGQAFANASVAAVHALAYPIGGHFHVPHGLSNALMLPHVLRFNAQSAANSYTETAICLFPHLAKLAQKERALALADEMAELSSRCGLEQRLCEVGIPQSALSMLASDAMLQTRLLPNNPRVVTEADALAMYEQAW